MKLGSLVAAHPVFFFSLLTIAILVLPSFIIWWCHNLAKHMKESVDANIQKYHSSLLNEIRNTATMLQIMNSSTTNLARLLIPLLNESKVTASDVNTKVAPLLFQALSTIPHISQVSYIGLEGLFFSYYYEGNQVFAMFTTPTSASNSSNGTPIDKIKYDWYKQAIDPNTGKPYAGPIKSRPFSMTNTSWIKEALNNTHWHASLGTGWNNAHDPLLLNSVGLNGKGIISLGILVEDILSFFSGLSLNNGSLYLAAHSGEVLLGGIPNTRVFVAGESVAFYWVQPTGDQVHIGDVSCMPNDGPQTTSLLSIGGREYNIHCSPIEILGLQLVYTLALPYDELPGKLNNKGKDAFILSIVMMAILFISVLSFISLMIRAARREMQLRRALIKQMEATQQAERKSMNKSNAFVSASHDIRSALLGIIASIDLSLESRSFDLDTHLTQVKKYTKELEGILNSVLDTSKIEAGKMPLEEEEFDIAELLQETVDLFYPAGFRKGIDVVLDPCDCSIGKYRRVKGDRVKLQKVLWNLLSNAVKFTSEGHISVRARAQKPSLENKNIASSNIETRFWRNVFCLFYKNNGCSSQMEVLKHRQNCMEFVFEVDDTGKGIPKDKRESVFENYVQVKDTSAGIEGTGLGLGIVQSLVRLMGGEIEIVDKENGERGTCFRFNVFLIPLDTPSAEDKRGDIETGVDTISDSAKQCLGLTVGTLHPGLTARVPSQRLRRLGSSPKVEGSHVVLLIVNEERRRVAHSYIERLGIKVSVVDRWEHLPSTLKKIKSKNRFSLLGSSGKSDLDSLSESSSTKSKELPLSSMEGTDQKLSVSRSAACRCTPVGLILLVIDASAGSLEEICRTVAEFRRELSGSCCKVVWLSSTTCRINLDDYGVDRNDVLFKPFHGTHIDEVLRILPEFGGVPLSRGPSGKIRQGSSAQDRKKANDLVSSSTRLLKIKTRSEIEALNVHEYSNQQGEIRSNDNTSSGDSCGLIRSKVHKHSPMERNLVRKQTSEIEEENDHGLGGGKPLGGKKILVVEDNLVLRKVARRIVSELGATVEICENGQEAVDLVCLGLEVQNGPPYHYVLMDCEMPKMNGYEATRRIRKEETDYGIHIPIIALSAHDSDEFHKMKDAGMDTYVGKPLTQDKLIDAINSLK